MSRRRSPIRPDVERQAGVRRVDLLAGLPGADGIALMASGESGRGRRRYPIYFQALLRYRTQESGGGSMHVGIGGGIAAWSETWDFGHGDEFKWGPHLLAVEALRSIPLSDRLHMKVGATMVLPFHIQPVVLFAWRF